MTVCDNCIVVDDTLKHYALAETAFAGGIVYTKEDGVKKFHLCAECAESLHKAVLHWEDHNSLRHNITRESVRDFG